MVRCRENCALTTYIRMGISTRGPNSIERRDNPSNCRRRARGSVPRRPLEEASSCTFLLMRAAVSPSMGMTDLGARIASWSFEDTIDSFLREISFFLASSTADFSGSLTFFCLTTTAFLSQRARPLSSPSSSSSSSDESESESGASQSTSLSSSSPLSESLPESSEELDAAAELLELLAAEDSSSESLSSASPNRSTFSSSSSSSSGFFR
mmetsp:Transcript_30845/g.64675  ORF Transcript_30845/g.64675 Transcript_30845/m.64675 type:complete len:210 (+) Transcript_30845:1091-1720(+)